MAEAGEACSEERVKSALEEFMKKHDPNASLETIDEIVLSYMVSVLEELGSDDATEDDFDVESFTEMMKEYLPSFDDIDSVAITEWMFQLAGQLKEPEKKVDLISAAITNALTIPAAKPVSAKRTHSTSEKEIAGSPLQNGAGATSSSSPSSCASGSSPSRGDPEVNVLMEMFPLASSMEVAHCLCVANGDVERAAQLILHRQETGESIKQPPKQPHVASGKKTACLNDSDMKKHIVSRYSFVDTDDDKRNHKPILPKNDDKKMVRYLDSKVVTLKGERFTEIKKPDEEEKMKKTFVNLKPAKQYRFH